MPPPNAMVDNRAFTAYNMVLIKLWLFAIIFGHGYDAPNCRSDLQVATSDLGSKIRSDGSRLDIWMVGTAHHICRVRATVCLPTDYLRY